MFLLQRNKLVFCYNTQCTEVISEYVMLQPMNRFVSTVLCFCYYRPRFLLHHHCGVTTSTTETTKFVATVIFSATTVVCFCYYRCMFLLRTMLQPFKFLISLLCVFATIVKSFCCNEKVIKWLARNFFCCKNTKNKKCCIHVPKKLQTHRKCCKSTANVVVVSEGVCADLER